MPSRPSDWPTTPSEESRWDAVRGSFLNDPGQIYLNTGSFGVLPRSVYEAMLAAVRGRELNVVAQASSL